MSGTHLVLGLGTGWAAVAGAQGGAQGEGGGWGAEGAQAPVLGSELGRQQVAAAAAAADAEEVGDACPGADAEAAVAVDGLHCHSMVFSHPHYTDP